MDHDADADGRAELAAGLRTALQRRRPYALSKMGFSEQACCVLPERLAAEHDPIKRRALEAALVTHGSVQGGLFPATSDSIIDFASLLQSSLHQQDGVAVAHGTWSDAALARVPTRTAVVDLDSLDVRRTDPDSAMQTLLAGLAGRDVLLVTTPADMLVSRAKPSTFEAVWSRVGRPWFEPRSVSGLALPDSYDPHARAPWGSSRALLDWAITELWARPFDVALIGAGLYGIPLAAAVKATGRIGISLGSQLQLLFGLQGRRWLAWEDFQRDIVTEHWDVLPSTHRDMDPQDLPDGGAYWS